MCGQISVLQGSADVVSGNSIYVCEKRIAWVFTRAKSSTQGSQSKSHPITGLRYSIRCAVIFSDQLFTRCIFYDFQNLFGEAFEPLHFHNSFP